ncbi:probable polygalacturonase [Ananas comosus]|uniref:Probable polygalacturonase n=1 Tax=Ananas comosus TaxID=4615 RepID=A0A6P5ENG1_ANACO|nr:probable polygalacturonase [Ananas comosus]
MGTIRTKRTLQVWKIVALWTVAAAALSSAAAAKRRAAGGERAAAGSCARAHAASVEDFGAVGDGATSNTAAFAAAVAHLARFESDGGAMLVVPPGRWLTGPFNITCSHFTLFLHRHAVILASQNISEWPAIDPLPSYGRGRDLPGPRYSNFIMGSNLTDVIITGDNGTIDGQGKFWWDKFHKKELDHTRGHLLEIMYSDHVLISNLTFVDSPFWTIHPVYSSNVIISGVTILAPTDSPNTDGIDPDSCSYVRIEDCYIVSGDDCIAVKSGWDEYGIAFNMPSQHIVIKRLTCVSPTSSLIALGSEMSGGIRDVRAEDVTAINTESGVRIKTSVGRGGFVRDVFVRGMTLHTMKWVFFMTGGYGQHPDDKYNPDALPVIEDIHYSNAVAENVSMVASLDGIRGDPFTGICISNVTAGVTELKKKKVQWNCTDVEGVWSDVAPRPCMSLRDKGTYEAPCKFPEERLPIESVEINPCSF